MAIRLTIDLYRDQQNPKQWTSRCVELDIISAGSKPERALEAVAEAVRMVVQYESRRHKVCTEQAFEKIAANVAARSKEASDAG